MSSTFVLAQRPEGAEPVDGVSFLDCDVAGAVRIGRDAAEPGAAMTRMPRPTSVSAAPTR